MDFHRGILGSTPTRANNFPSSKAACEKQQCLLTPGQWDILRDNLQQRGYSAPHISAAVQKLEAAADATCHDLYPVNLRTYQLLRYGVPVQIAAGRSHETVQLVDWEHPEQNDFALAEEVTLRGGYQRRPDIVLYLNGIAIAVLELKRSSVEVADGVRQTHFCQAERRRGGPLLVVDG